MKKNFRILPVVSIFFIVGSVGYLFLSKPTLSAVDQHKKWGIEFFEKRDFERAEVQFRAAKKLAPDDPITLYYLASLNLELKNYGKAASYAAESIRLNPKSDDGYHYLGRALQGEKKYNQAIKAFKYSNKLKKFTGNYIQTGFCYLKLKKLKKGIKAFKSANRLAPSVSAYFGLGRSYYLLGDNEKALKSYRLASKYDNLWTWKDAIRKNTGFLYASMGELNKAAVFFKHKFVVGLTYERSDKGILITEVNRGMPGDRAGLLAGDILSAIDGVSLGGNDLNTFSEFVGRKPLNASMRLTVKRAGEHIKLDLQKSIVANSHE